MTKQEWQPQTQPCSSGQAALLLGGRHWQSPLCPVLFHIPEEQQGLFLWFSCLSQEGSVDGAVCPCGCCCRRGRNVASRGWVGGPATLGSSLGLLLGEVCACAQARFCCASCNYARCFKVVEIGVLKLTWENFLNLAQRGSSSMSHLQLWRSPGQSLPPPCWMDLSECSEPQSREEKYPSSFPKEVCMGVFPTRALVGVCGTVFFSPSAPHKNIVQLEILWAHPQEADNSVDMPVAAEEVASVTTNKQSAKVQSLGGCQNKFDIKLFCLFGFCLLVWRCFPCFLTFKSHIWQDFHHLTPPAPLPLPPKK